MTVLFMNISPDLANITGFDRIVFKSGRGFRFFPRTSLSLSKLGWNASGVNTFGIRVHT